METSFKGQEQNLLKADKMEYNVKPISQQSFSKGVEPKPAYLFFEMAINWETVRALETRVISYIKSGVKEVNIIVSSSGGLVSAGVTCHNMLSSLPIKINTHNFSEVNSALLLVYMVGERRTCATGGRFLFHPVRFENNSNLTASEYRDIVKNLEGDTDRIALIYSSILKITTHRAKELMEQERWFDAYEAREIGLASEVSNLKIPEQSIIEMLPIPD